ncbi:putative repeat protein (TIGR01451 family) [Nocardiopsis sp. Huas11]|uniref:DUF11 domain-containing protein n=1 Tax=Nocardiopsis sp. Huas11 TaxID=2183912 RepID=UPI000EAB5389|nr:DUF11 domain-containing protein [Nocardiopsis sp. Huas11]RKS04502.1 putative repeat protein (TIGR01451 family) [Nocardiopsis sp. Huas11]
MGVSAVMSAMGLAALIALPAAQPAVEGGEAPRDGEAVPGAGNLHVTVEDDVEDRLSPGDRVHYTIRVRNSGYEPLPDAQIVQLLPPGTRHVSDSGEGSVDAEASRVVWDQPLEPGERASLAVTTEVRSRPEAASRTVTTVCLRPEPGAALVACTAAVHRVHGVVPAGWVAAGLVVLAALAVGGGGLARYRSVRRGPRPDPDPERTPVPEPEVPEDTPAQDTGLEPVSNVRTFPGAAPVYHLDAHR